MSHLDEAIALLREERADLLQRADWLGEQIEELRKFGAHVPAPRPVAPREVRRGSSAHLIVGYLTDNPGSTAQVIADALGFKRNSVSTRLTQMAKEGLLVKEERGYSVPATT